MKINTQNQIIGLMLLSWTLKTLINELHYSKELKN